MNDNSLVFYIAFIAIFGFVLGEVMGIYIQFIPYFVAGTISLLPFYNEVRKKSNSQRLLIKTKIVNFLRQYALQSVIVLVIVVLMLKEKIATLSVTIILLSGTGLLMVGCFYSIFRAVYKANKQVELPSYLQLCKSVFS